MPAKPAIVSISRTTEKHRSHETVLPLVREAIDRLGGMQQFVKPGQSVFIKPNQTVFYSAEEGCTTDPYVVGALVCLAKEAGASKVTVGDSSGGFFDSMDCMEITGIKAAAEKFGAAVVDLGSDKTPNRTVPIPNGTVIKSVPLPVPLADADVIIDVPKAKNHHIEPISGALKNWVGTVNQNWRETHHGDLDMFARFVDIMSVIRPHLCVVDALIIGEGDGPIANLPRWCGCILASSDPVATDVSICKLLGHDPAKLTFVKEAEKRGLGVADPIEYRGVPLETAAIQAWPGHEGFDYLPVNFLVGQGVTLPGTVGHVKSVLDSMLRRGELPQVIWLKGTPTFMLGEIEDPHFEEHLTQGPYIVFDDAALPKYKHDPRVHFVPGHPVLRAAMPQVMKGMGTFVPGKAIMKMQQFQRWGMHNTRYGSPGHKAITVAKPLAAGIAVALGITLAGRLWARR